MFGGLDFARSDTGKYPTLEPLLPAPQRSACCHRSQLAAGHARSFGLRLVRLLSAQLAVVLHCLADWLDGGRVSCKLTKTEHFFRWMRGGGRGHGGSSASAATTTVDRQPSVMYLQLSSSHPAPSCSCRIICAILQLF